LSTPDLTRFTRSFMGQVEDDLGTQVDWVAVNHYDTDHPHTHVLVRGADAGGQPLTIQRSYIAHGLRHRAQEIATHELGPRREVAHEQDVARTPQPSRVLGPRREPMPEQAVARAPQPTRNRGMDLDV
jgi:type IV secretory pathway VirD2 relaxase